MSALASILGKEMIRRRGIEGLKREKGGAQASEGFERFVRGGGDAAADDDAVDDLLTYAPLSHTHEWLGE